MKKRWSLRSSFALCCLGILGHIGVGQTNSAVIVGSVLDSTGAAVPNASVTITNQGTGISSTVVANSDGQYTATSLEPGAYSVSVKVSGFEAETVRNVNLFVNQTARVPLDSTPGEPDRQKWRWTRKNR